MSRDHILVEVLCPATSRSYDFIIYKRMTVCQAIDKIAGQIKEFEGNDIIFDDTSSLDLFSSEYSLPLDKELIIENCNIKSGSSLMIV